MTRYYQNGIDVTFYIENKLALPMSERFFPIVVKTEDTSHEDEMNELIKKLIEA